MKIHPLAELFPSLSGEDMKALVADIAENGLQFPVTTYKNQILDGQHRAKACEEAGVVLKTREYKGGDPGSFVLSANLHRRHWTAGQKAMTVAGVLDWRERGVRSAPGADLKDAENQGVAANAMAKMVGVGTRTVERAKQVAANGSVALQKAVTDGDISLKAAAAVTDKPKSEQLAAAKKPKPKKKFTENKQKSTEDFDSLKVVHEKLIVQYNELRENRDDLADELKSVEEFRSEDAVKANVELRAEIRRLERRVGDLMNQTVEMQRQIKMWRRKAEAK